MSFEERRARIVIRQAADAIRHDETRFEDLRTTLGRLTSAMCNEARWRAEEHLYPYAQVYANEIEAVLKFAEAQRQLGRYWPRLTARKAQRDSALDELRIAFHLHSSQFKITEWEPVGENERLGEYRVCGPSGRDMFVEAKGPRWEGELKGWEIQNGRTRRPKDLYSEGRFVNPRKRIQLEVDKAYGKFRADSRNLLVMAGYRGFMSLDDSNVRRALYEARYSGCFSTPAFEKLGGVGILSMSNDDRESTHELRIFVNRFALEALPDDCVRAFGADLPSSPEAMNSPAMKTLILI